MAELLLSFGLRDWLLVLGPVFIVAVLLHGYWRMRVNRNSLKMALDKSFLSDAESDQKPDDLAMFKAELPNGGARVRQIPEQTALNLQQEVPVLMEPVLESGIEVSTHNAPVAAAATAPAVAATVRVTAAQRPEKFIVIYVVSELPFAGQKLLEVLVEQKMSLGEMDIFHRQDDSGEAIFSLVNAIEPGTFDLQTMAELEFPAVSLFMRVHELNDPLQVFEQMIDVAQTLADDLGGQVRDETRSVMTTQTIDFCRQDINQYTHKHRLD